MEYMTPELLCAKMDEHRLFVNDCLTEIKRIVAEQASKSLYLSENFDTACIIVSDGTEDDGIVEERVRELFLKDGMLNFVNERGYVYDEKDIIYTDAIYPYVLYAVYQNCPPKEDYREIVDKHIAVNNEAKTAVKNLILEHGEVNFSGWADGDCPSLISTMFQEDVTDAQVKRLWLKDGEVYADLYAYYLEESVDNINVEIDEPNVNWVDMLDWIITELN